MHKIDENADNQIVPNIIRNKQANKKKETIRYANDELIFDSPNILLTSGILKNLQNKSYQINNIQHQYKKKPVQTFFQVLQFQKKELREITVIQMKNFYEKINILK